MYQPAHLDSFLRLLISHLGSVLTQGEVVKDWQDSEARMDLLLDAIDSGENSGKRPDKESRQRDAEALFVLQLSQSREWVDRLGRLDPDVERDTDEFLAATFSIENLLQDRRSRDEDYRLENRLSGEDNDNVLRCDSCNQVNIDRMTCAIFELLGRLEDHYDLMDELLEVREVVNGSPFSRSPSTHKSATVIPLFPGIKRTLHQDNKRK